MLDIASPLDIFRPPVVRFGTGGVSGVADWIKISGARRPFVICDPVNAKRLELLGPIELDCYSAVEKEPDVATLEAAVCAANASEADFVIGFGGGSAMDLAKLVAVMTGTSFTIGDISGPGRAPNRKVGLIQIPTTAGTGSEVGTRALITDPATQNKIATESQNMLADAAFIDPELTCSVPSHVTAATGVDALAHCVEALTSRRAHPTIDLYALEGARLVGRYLKRAVDDGNDIEARAGMALAAYYGGLCLGPVNTTAGHAVAYPLGSRHGLPHGIANALVFPHVLAVNAHAVEEKTLEVAQALGFAARSTDEVLDGALQYCRSLGISMHLRDYSVPRDDLETMAREAAAIRRLMDWNPVDLTAADVLRIYEAAW